MPFDQWPQQSAQRLALFLLSLPHGQTQGYASSADIFSWIWQEILCKNAESLEWCLEKMFLTRINDLCCQRNFASFVQVPLPPCCRSATPIPALPSARLLLLQILKMGKCNRSPMRNRSKKEHIHEPEDQTNCILKLLQLVPSAQKFNVHTDGSRPPQCQ